MRYSLKKVFSNALLTMGIGYSVIRNMDYETLSQYILKIQKHLDIDNILYEVSRCLKEVLDYELFGFALKDGNAIDLWIDPKIYSTQFRDHVMKDYDGQNIDCRVHDFDQEKDEKRHIPDKWELNNLFSYEVIYFDHSARLYIVPKKKILSHHSAIIRTIISSISVALEKNMSIQQLESAAAIDPLTTCYNRRALDKSLEHDIAYARRYGKNLSVMMFDIDNFKKINDMHGHVAGDAVLMAISAQVQSLVRKSDYLARYGGEEFILVLRDTVLNDAAKLADKLRKAIESMPIVLGDKNIRVTASFGVSSLENKLYGSAVIQEADERMYTAKSMGKNCVVPDLNSLQSTCFMGRSFGTPRQADRCIGVVRAV